jgi:hypothetical protein
LSLLLSRFVLILQAWLWIASFIIENRSLMWFNGRRTSPHIKPCRPECWEPSGGCWENFMERTETSK